MINCRIAQFIYVKNAPTTLTKNMANKKKTKWYRIFIKVNLQKDEKNVTSFLVDLLNLRKKINFFYRIGTYELNMVKTLLKMLLDVGSCW